MFTKKGQKVVEMNIEALHQGYELMKDKLDTVNGAPIATIFFISAVPNSLAVNVNGNSIS
jgi:hypothetical protein